MENKGTRYYANALKKPQRSGTQGKFKDVITDYNTGLYFNIKQ